MNYFDFIVIMILLTAFYGGYQNGLIKSVFSTIGYIAGGVLGLAAAVRYLSNWQSELQKVGLALLAILLGAIFGEFLIGKIGLLFREVLFVPPIKIIDSLLGALIVLIRSAFILYIITILLVFSNWKLAGKYVGSSYFYQILEARFPLEIEFFDKNLG